MKLLKLLKKKPFCNDLHLILIPILLFLVGFKYYLFFIALALYLIYIFLKTKLIIPILSLILVFSLDIFLIKMKEKIEIKDNIDAYIKEINDENNYIILYKGILIKVNEYNHQNNPGDIINLDIKIEEIEEKSYQNDFDYKEYLKTEGITYLAKGKTLKKKNSFFSISSLKYNYLKYLKKHLSIDTYTYVSRVVFNQDNMDKELKDSYSILGISHIFAISGLHIIFLFNILSFIFLHLFHYYKKGIPLFIISLYVILIGAPASALRGLLFLIIGTINKKDKVLYTRLDILSISMLIMLLINPYSIFQTGFLLSYLVSFVLLFNKKEEGLKGIYKTYILIYFSTFPLVINMTNKLSFISLLLSPIFSLVIVSFLLPLSYILALFPILDYITKYVFIFLNMYVKGIVSYNLFIRIPSFNIYLMIIYYILFIILIIFVSKRKRIILPLIAISSYLVLIINLRYLNPFYKITFIDCGQGDSALIELPNNKGTILIDLYNSYDYIKSLGISKIDIVIFSHSDSDHIGDYQKVFEEFKVSKIYYPLFDTKFDELNIKGYPLTNLDTITISNLKLQILGPINKYEDANSNSLVVKFKIENTTYLFTGDMTEKEENDLIKFHGTNLKSDILKVGHHGSNTSSSIPFLNKVLPEISIVSVKKNNSYNLPNKEIIDRLEKISKVYITYKSGNISIYQYKKEVYVRTYR